MLAAASVLTGFSDARAEAGVKVIEAGGDGMTLAFSLDSYDTTRIVAAGAEYVSFTGQGLLQTGEEGSPTLPVKAVLVAAPHGARIEVSVLSEEIEWLPDVVPVPWPKESIVDDDVLTHSSAEFVPSPRFYGPGGVYPERAVEVREVGTLRGYRIASIVFWPFRYDAGRGGIEVRKNLVVKVEFIGGMRPRSAPGRSGDRRWEPLLRGLLLNYSDASGWRRSTPSVFLQRSLPPSGPQLKLWVGRTSLYRVRYEDLSAAGFPQDVGLEGLRLSLRSYSAEDQATVETEVALSIYDEDQDGLFTPGDSFVFYGLGYFDRFPDRVGKECVARRNVYWLSVGEGGLRMSDTPAWEDLLDPKIPVSFRQTMRYEQDKVLNGAPYDADTYLFWLPPGMAEETLQFEVPSPDLQLPYGMRVTMQPSWSGEHLISLFTVNGLGESDTLTVRKSFSSKLQPTQKPPFVFDSGLSRPAGFLSEGADALRLVGERKSGSTIVPQLGAYVDCFEVTYYRRYVAWKDTLTCPTVEAGPVELRMQGFSSDDLVAFDVSDPIQPLSFQLGPANILDGGDGTYTLVIRGEFQEPRLVAAAVAGGIPVLDPENIELDVTADLAAEGAGSDYIVVVHDALVDEVLPLVTMREAQGFKVAVARVSDVYDEFGGGLSSAQAIKDYLTYAYRNWGSAYALMVGEASEDHEGILTGRNGAPTPPDLVPSQLFLHYGVSNAPGGPRLINSDSWYGVWLDGDSSDWLPDMFIGRLPAETLIETRDLVAKIVAYEKFAVSDQWRSRGLFISDDDYSLDIFGQSRYCYSLQEARIFEPVSDRSSAALQDEEDGVPGFVAPVFSLDRYLGSFPGDPKEPCYPGLEPPHNIDLIDFQNHTRAEITPVLLDTMSLGWLFVNYQGHGNASVWTHESLFTSFKSYPGLDDVPLLGNTARPFMLFAYSCHVADFDDVGEADSGDCIAERILLLPDAGAVSAFASTGYEYLTTGYFNEPIISALLVDPPVEEQDGDVHIRLGPAIAKGEALYWGVLGSNRSALQTYVLLGDPAMRVDTAPPRIVASLGDTVLADGDKLESLNGEDTFALHFEIRDEVAVDSTSIFLREVWHRFEGQDSTYNVPSSEYTASRAPGGRRYDLDYTVRLLPASMEMIAGAVDRNGRQSTMTLRAVLSASWHANGRPISPGDLVDSSVDLLVKVTSPVPVSGEALSVLVDGLRESAFVPRQTDALGRRWELSVEGYGFQDGIHTLSLLVDGRAAASVSVRVDTRFRFSSIVPYPSPCGSEGTTFFYELTSVGAVEISEVVLKIFSVSGRLVAELTDASPAIGRGSVHWDAADSYGDAVANGVYICRAVASDSRGRKATTMSKVAVAR